MSGTMKGGEHFFSARTKSEIREKKIRTLFFSARPPLILLTKVATNSRSISQIRTKAPADCAREHRETVTIPLGQVKPSSQLLAVALNIRAQNKPQATGIKLMELVILHHQLSCRFYRGYEARLPFWPDSKLIHHAL